MALTPFPRNAMVPAQQGTGRQSVVDQRGGDVEIAQARRYDPLCDGLIHDGLICLHQLVRRAGHVVCPQLGRNGHADILRRCLRHRVQLEIEEDLTGPLQQIGEREVQHAHRVRRSAHDDRVEGVRHADLLDLEDVPDHVADLGQLGARHPGQVDRLLQHVLQASSLLRCVPREERRVRIHGDLEESSHRLQRLHRLRVRRRHRGRTLPAPVLPSRRSWP